MISGSPLVFTDMDGSLLDHHDYSWSAAAPLLAQLEQAGIPVIPATSKTRAELEVLRSELDNCHPFIVENGAAVFIPQGYFPRAPEGVIERDGYWVREFSVPRSHWLGLLGTLRHDFAGEFTCFAHASDEEIVAMTGLTPEAAHLANQREYSEPTQWLGEPVRKVRFLEELREHGANPLQGGRFLTLAGDCDKGRALAWLREAYASAGAPHPIRDLGIGDSGNDVAMLEATETALVIRSPVHEFPQLSRQHDIIYSTGFGPAGWSEGVAKWLASISGAGITV
ncbi:HAD-IIB family hydrolase [Mangrovimicrobium sediminis]|uniref:HAD-IIB family hydrolase n=1 Tax=Mangrovimicrobium sediminis TaxID=2562682 RepID=A0A4Z0M348_9GAMM|nr:HAD-IIB family hydrolase [Haliea sp. SAOS-164]TGD74113.1 HAD-IIB family hydrolase [Haliea sp. SAOS-164]